MRYYFVAFLFALASISVSAQLSQKVSPKSNLIGNLSDPKFIELPESDNEKLLAEDNLNAESKELPLRFGVPFELNADFFEEADEVLPGDGSAVYRLGIYSKGATSLNLTFSYFDLPEGASLHVYDVGKKLILGAFTEKNERIDHLFATNLIRSDSIVIEVFLPDKDIKGKVQIDKAIHGYRDIFDLEEGFNSSGNCNINVSCSEAGPWGNQIRSVVLTLSGGSNNYLCSAALINNVKEDGTPYILSANHCPLAPNNVVVFNYQSRQCSPSVDSNLSHSINGLSILARSGLTDFLLAELSSIPPNNFRPYYSGWNNSGVIPKKSTCIHHPQGDLKKISFDYKPALSSGYYTFGQNHWQISSWDLGTTENGSSGSALFNEDKLIVGQLHGGDASCDDPDEEDYFGKLSLSWQSFSDSSKQLKYWLDPDNSGATSLHGYDPLNAHVIDLAALGFTDASLNYCGFDSIAPKLLVKNRGSQTVNGFTVSYYLNNIQVLSFNETATIAPGSLYLVEPQFFKVSPGHYNLKAEVTINSDYDISNNYSNSEFSLSSNSFPVELTLKTDDDGNETSWELLSSSGSQITSGGDYNSKPGGEIIKDTFCLFDGCFEFKIYDDFGDGICCDFGTGYYFLRDLSTGDTIFSSYNFKGSDSSHVFCLGDTCSIRARAFIKDATGVTNNDGSIDLEMLAGLPPFSYIWSTGALTESLNNIPAGQYWVYISDSLNCSDTLFFEVGILNSVITDVDLNSQLNLYPNPTRGLVFIEGLKTDDEYELTVYNTKGMAIQKQRIHASAKAIELDFKEYKNGLYLVVLKSEKSVYRIRMMIAK